MDATDAEVVVFVVESDVQGPLELVPYWIEAVEDFTPEPASLNV